ncbi:MAG: Cys-rich protein [Spirochaetia bacterium]|nr:Cys-rich protein [Spirochaetia bacterium]
MSFLKKSIYIGILGIFSFLALPSFLLAECSQACDKFITCTEEVQKTKATVQQKATLGKACAETCKKQGQQINECFEKSNEAGGSCQAYSTCIMKYAQLMKSAKK